MARRPALAGLLALLAAGCLDLGEVELIVPDAAVPDAAPPTGCLADTECALPGARARCVDGACVIGACEPGFVDADGRADNGCEDACVPRPGPDRCDGEDSDCDGALDEDGDDTPLACGACDRACAGPDAVYACRAGACAIAGCVDGRYNPDGRPETGCACDAADRSIETTDLPPGAAPEQVRLAFPGDGGPGAVVWVDTREDAPILRRWDLTPDGYPIGDPRPLSAVDADLDEDTFVVDAWFEGPTLRALVAEEVFGDRLRDIVLFEEDRAERIDPDCDLDDCLPVRLPDGVGFVRVQIQTDAEGNREATLRGPDGDALERWAAPNNQAITLRSAACFDRERCLVLYARGDLLHLAGLFSAPLEGAESGVIVRNRDTLWLGGRTGQDINVVTITPDLEIGMPQVVATGLTAPDLLPLPDGGAWLVAERGRDTVALRLAPDGSPIGELWTIPGGFTPVGAADDGVFFDHSPRAASLDRLLWLGLPRGAVLGDRPPTLLVTDRAWALYRGAGGVFAAELGPSPGRPILLARSGADPRTAPAAAPVDGVPTLVEPGPQGLVVVTFADGVPARRPLPLAPAPELADGGPVVELEAAVAALPGGGARVAVIGRLADGRGVVGEAPIDAPEVPLWPAAGPAGEEVAEEAPLLLGDPPALITRGRLGVGFVTRVRLLDGARPGPPSELARRFAAPMAAAGLGDRILLGWLDRRRDACGNGATDVRLAILDPGALPVEAPLPLPEGACPQAIALAPSAGGGVHALVGLGGAGIVLATLDRDGVPQGEPVPLAAPNPLYPALVGLPDGPLAAWPRGDAVQHLDLRCE